MGLVEENDAVRESLAKAMRAWGLKVTPFSSEESALTYLVWPSGSSSGRPSGRTMNNILLDFVIMDKDCKGLMKALVEQKRDISIAFIVWPAADEINGIGDTSKNLKTPLENNLGTLQHQEAACHEQGREVRREEGDGQPAGGPGREVQDFDCRGQRHQHEGVPRNPDPPWLCKYHHSGRRGHCVGADRVQGRAERLRRDLHGPAHAEKGRYGDKISSKIVAVTADAFAETKEKCFVQGFTHWIAKPFRIKDIEKIFESHSSDNS